jgi:precorrin-8X/cobalt-precorrin-8 methylmutase
VLFDTYVIVDWSAARTPKTGRDSIWVCRHGPDSETVVNPPTRHAARELLAGILEAAITNGERVLAGFDFPFGYPAGFARRLGLEGTPWRALWDEIACLIDDRADNHNTRFEVGAGLNHRVSGKRFPFWGCPVGFAHEYLGPRHHGGHNEDELLKERRLIDKWMVGAQPCWKLAYTGSVGSQALTGIPVVRSLRDDPRWADQAQIWPFETDLRAPIIDARIVLAEVWPSWWKVCPKLGPPNDKAQVRTVARIFASADRVGELGAWFSPQIGDADPYQIVSEEAWTLGVTAPRHKKSSFPRKREPRAATSSSALGFRPHADDEKSAGPGT